MDSKLLFDGVLFALTHVGWSFDVRAGHNVAFLHQADTIIKVWTKGSEVRICDAGNLEYKK